MAAAARVAGPAARSVVVVWGTFPQRVAASGGIAYVAGEHLHDWLLAQRHCLNRAELAALSAANVRASSRRSHALANRTWGNAVSRPGSDPSRPFRLQLPRTGRLATCSRPVRTSPQDVQFRPQTPMKGQLQNRRSEAVSNVSQSRSNAPETFRFNV
jgi:hypothetical protein